MSRKIKNAEADATAETKTTRIAVGATVAGVLLAVFLVVVLIIQFAQMGVKRAEKRKLENTVEQYEKLNQETEKDLEFYKTEEGLRMLAVRNGWTKDSSKK